MSASIRYIQPRKKSSIYFSLNLLFLLDDILAVDVNSFYMKMKTTIETKCLGGCGSKAPHHAKGLCKRCYMRLYMREKKHLCITQEKAVKPNLDTV